jgi:large subunit ribosomal protein L25
MAETEVLVAERRAGKLGSRTSRRLRKQEKVPGIVYGHQEAAVSVAFTLDDLHRVLRHGVRVLELQVDGNKQKVLIQDLQHDFLGKEVLHVDFKRVSDDERIEVSIPLVLRGEAPGLAAGGILDQPLHELDVECPAFSVPESIRVNINELQMDAFLRVRDLDLPEGVKAVTGPEEVILHIRPPVVEPEAGEEEAGEQAEPELIKKEKEEEEGGE